MSGLQHDGYGFARRHYVLWLQLYRRVFYGQGMWRRAIHWHVRYHKVLSNSLGSHSIQQSWDRGDHDTNPQQSDLYGCNHGSHPGKLQPISCIWDDSSIKTFCRSPNFHSKGGPWLYSPVFFQRGYTWSNHKKPNGQRATGVSTCYLLVGAWLGSTECSLLQELAYCRGRNKKEHWRSHDGGIIPWPHQHRQWQWVSGPNLWYQHHDKSDDWQCQIFFGTIK